MTHLGPTLVVTGDLTSEEDVILEGRMKGSMDVRGATLTVGQQGRLEGTIRAVRVAVHGAVQGRISATERIELSSSAQVTADLSATNIAIADGAQFNGRIDMARRTIAASVAHHKAAAT
jgi:cytoskeletal protein CcmA (bactofilin family)